MSRYEKHVTTRPCHVREKKKMLQLTHLICIIRSTRYLDDKTCHFFLTNPCHKIYWQMSRDEMAKELHGYVMTCIEGYIKKSLSCLNLMAGTSCRKK